MKYYVLKINGRMVRKHDIEQGGDCDGAYVAMYCEYTDDINLAEKYTKKEIQSNTGEAMYVITYLTEYSLVDGVVEIEDWEFVEVEL